MKILITGGCGFIGSNFVRFMLKKYSDYRLINIDKLTYAGNRDNLKDLESDPRYTFVHGDICDRKLVSQLAQGCDAIINFAAESHVDRSIEDASPFIRTDIVGVHSLLEAARKAKVKRFIQISTDEVYGAISHGHFVETDPFQPNNPYSASKAAGELLARSYLVTHKLPVLITRSSNNYGPYHHPEKLIPRCITNVLQNKKIPLHGSGSAIRDWLYVIDNCEAIDLVLHKGVIGEVYNIGSNNEETNINVAKAILKDLGKDDSFIDHIVDRPGQDMRYALNSDKIRKLGWKPKYSFAQGLKETIDWYRKNRAWWEKINRIIIAGANMAGHAGVVVETLKLKNEYQIAGFLDNAMKGKKVDGFDVLGGTDAIPADLKVEAGFVAIGNNHERKAVAEKLISKGIKIISIIHPHAVISEEVSIGDGTFIGAGAIIGSNVKLGNNVIVGSGSTIEHDSIIGSNVHIAPGVNIDTRVRIKDGAYLGIGSKVIPDITVGANVVIPAGQVVTQDVKDAPEADKKYTGETFYNWKK